MEHINFHEVNDNASKDDYTYIAHSYISSEGASEKDIDSDTLLATLTNSSSGVFEIVPSCFCLAEFACCAARLAGGWRALKEASCMLAATMAGEK